MICLFHEPEQLGLEGGASSPQLQLSGTHCHFTFAPRPSVAVSFKHGSRLIFSPWPFTELFLWELLKRLNWTELVRLRPPPSVLWHCCLGHETCRNIIPEMTCNVPSAMLNLIRGTCLEESTFLAKKHYWQGENWRGGLGRWTPPSSCLQTLIFEWKSALNFNPWAKFQTFQHTTPPPSFFRSVLTLITGAHIWVIMTQAFLTNLLQHH